ncbi:hypothetical protein ACF8GB_19065 [Pseudomonas sp. xss_4]|uniref:Uncharacterized protein n=1 Tax=Pseudomonas paracarnis TaxID=2750625 RepID=A0ABU6BRA3_9PSED|nr:hypothetical protein [Pseudomonas paracarnis]MEB3782412.1 hypothetical protein [Pseudomonas paracarnis]HDS0926279.1 hypothetical protein [Pseudomonas putida]
MEKSNSQKMSERARQGAEASAKKRLAKSILKTELLLYISKKEKIQFTKALIFKLSIALWGKKISSERLVMFDLKGNHKEKLATNLDSLAESLAMKYSHFKNLHPSLLTDIQEQEKEEQYEDRAIAALELEARAALKYYP